VTSVELLLYLHYLSLFLMVAGLGALMVAVWRGYREDEIDRQIVAFEDAMTGHRAGLLPGTIAVGATGVFLAADAGYNFFTTAWLLALELVYLLVLLVLVPLLGHALGRIEIETLKSKKKNEPTAQLQELLDDNVPVVLSLLIVMTLPVMVWLAEFKPF
jgi:uncharacterized membrane protein